MILLSSAALVQAQPKNISTFSLSNGMDAVVIEDHRAPIVTHMVWYRVGSADESPGKSGIAHFLEHLMFKGTEKMKPGEFSDIVAANGGSENAFTSYDYTGYYQRVAADRLDLMMGLEADRMRNLVLSEAEVLPERDVVLEERNSRVENNPSALFSEQRRAAQFQNHRYGVPVIGWKHEVANLTQEDALEFYRTYYAPNNAILIVAGDVTPAEVEALALKYYGPLEPSLNLPARARVSEPRQLAPRRLIFDDPRVRQPYMIRTYLAPTRKPGDQSEAAALVMLSELLGGSGITSVLGEALQLEQKKAINVAAFYSGVALDDDTFGIYAIPSPGVSLQEVEDAMDIAVAEFIRSGVNQEHLKRLKGQIRASQIYALDDQAGLARRYGSALTAGLTLEDIHNWPDVLQAVTAEDIIAVAQKIFDPRNSVTGWLTSTQDDAL